MIRSWRLLPLIVAAGLAGYWYLTGPAGQAYAVRSVAAALAVGLAVAAFDLMFGVAHQLSLGHSVFFGLGAYTYAIAAGPDHELPPAVAMVLAVLLAGLVAALLGAVLLRIRGFQFAVATLAVAIIGERSARTLRSVTGGDDGKFVEPLSFFGRALDTPFSHYLFTLGVAAVGVVVLRNLRDSLRGRTARLVGADPVVAETLGIGSVATDRTIFVTAAMFTALAGVLFATAVGYLTPEQFGILLAVEMVVMAVIGRPGSILGPFVGALALWLLPVYSEPAEEHRAVLTGVLLILAMILLPEAGGRRARSPRPAGRAARSLRAAIGGRAS